MSKGNDKKLSDKKSMGQILFTKMEGTRYEQKRKLVRNMTEEKNCSKQVKSHKKKEIFTK